MKFAALVSLALFSLAGAGAVGPIETCVIQKDYISITLDRVVQAVPNTFCPGCTQYKICLTLTGLPAGKTLSHTCVKPSNICPVADFYLYNATYRANQVGSYGEYTGPGNGFTQCQWAQAGTYAYFLLKDGSSCRPPTNSSTPDYAIKTIDAVSPAGTNVTVSAECRSRFGWETTGQLIRSCTGNNANMECVWKVQAPTGDCRDPVNIYDIDCDQCAPLTNECRNEVAEYPGYMSLDIANCGQPDALVDLLKEYGCEKSKLENCNVIYCTSFISSSILADYDTMQCPILR